MVLLFDENLAHALVAQLADIYPGSRHIRDTGLLGEPDPVVWDYAKQEGLAIVSKDRDFMNRSHYYGHPPKVIWLCVGNLSTKKMEERLRSNATQIQAFLADTATSCLTVT
jgi:predicted nuclease of predicted toxin-antitoxin system